MKAIAHKRQQRVAMGKGLEQIMLALPNAWHGGCKNERVQWRSFKFVADRPINGLGFQKVIGVDRLRRAIPGLDFLIKHGRRHHHRVQEGSFPQAAMRVGCARAQQYGRGIDGTPCKYIMFCYYFYSLLRFILLP